MKVMVIFHRKEEVAPAEFEKLLEPEDKHGFTLYRDDILREIYGRSDGKGAIAVLECENEAHAERLVAELPMMKAGLLRVDIYGAVPYRAISLLAG